MSLTQLVMDKALAIMYNLKVSFSNSANSTFALLSNRKGIPKTTSMLMSARKKVFSKNWAFFRLSLSTKLADAIP